MSRWIASLVLLAACPKKTETPAAPAAPGAGCPSASGVYMAMYIAPPEGEQGYTGWVLPLHDVKLGGIAGTPGYATIDAATASAAGVPAPPSSVWVLPPNGAMCKATPGNYYAVTLAGTTPNVTYGVELSGCPAPKEDVESAIALVSDAAPSGCRVTAPRPVASRLGETHATHGWQPPTKETAMPPAFAALVPTTECTAPACHTLWSVAAVELDGKPVAYGGAVNWIKPATGGACAWSTDAWSGFFVVAADGSLVQVREGQDHPLALTLLLSDPSGRQVLLAQGPGEYTAYDLANGAATVGRHVVWLIDEPDAYAALDHLGPECGPPAAP